MAINLLQTYHSNLNRKYTGKRSSLHKRACDICSRPLVRTVLESWITADYSKVFFATNWHKAATLILFMEFGSVDDIKEILYPRAHPPVIRKGIKEKLDYLNQL